MKTFVSTINPMGWPPPETQPYGANVASEVLSIITQRGQAAKKCIQLTYRERRLRLGRHKTSDYPVVTLKIHRDAFGHNLVHQTHKILRC